MFAAPWSQEDQSGRDGPPTIDSMGWLQLLTYQLLDNGQVVIHVKAELTLKYEHLTVWGQAYRSLFNIQQS